MLQIFTELFGVAFISSITWGIGRGLHAAISRPNERKRIHGQFIPEWVGGTVLASGIAGLLYFGPVPNVPSPPSGGMAAFGILGGLILGTIHGWIRMACLAPDITGPVGGVPPDSTNPYEPPIP